MARKLQYYNGETCARIVMKKEEGSNRKGYSKRSFELIGEALFNVSIVHEKILVHELQGKEGVCC